MYIRAEPAHPTLAQRARTKLLELYANLAKIRETTSKRSNQRNAILFT